jgi:methyltransferase family protein
LEKKTVTQRRWWRIAGLIVIVVTLGLVLRNQVKVYLNRRARAEAQAAQTKNRDQLFQMLQPVVLSNCELQRFGEAHDGGYLMCGNLLRDVQSGYSYGISGYDKWGCDISSGLGITVHQYDCFNTTRPECAEGKTVFHEECVGGVARTHENRAFDTIANQFAKNGDAGRRIVLKIDVEGAEWESFAETPDATLEQIDQLAVEFHGVNDGQMRGVVEKLKRHFHVAHIHFNNFSCVADLLPFPSWAYEVLFVSKRLGRIDPRGKAGGGLHPLDAPNSAELPDCQPTSRDVKPEIASAPAAALP